MRVHALLSASVTRIWTPGHAQTAVFILVTTCSHSKPRCSGRARARGRARSYESFKRERVRARTRILCVAA